MESKQQDALGISAEDQMAADQLYEDSEVDDKDEPEDFLDDDDDEDEDEKVGDEKSGYGDQSKDFQSLFGWNESDSENEKYDDEEKNRIGSAEMLKFYENYDHIGYNLKGKKVMKPIEKDTLDDFIARQDDPNYWLTIRDEVNGKDIKLSKDDYKMILSLVKGRLPPTINAYEEFLDTPYEHSLHPLTNKPVPKARFLPSKHESRKISKLVRAIRRGWLKIDDESKQLHQPDLRIWDEDDNVIGGPVKRPPGLKPPKPPLPTHAESYNPPEEYLFSEKEHEKFLKRDPELLSKKANFVPKKIESIRKIPAYENFVKERFERLLDLFLAPRVANTPHKLGTNPEALLPQLPSPKDLKPFPTKLSIIFSGHRGKITSISVHPGGQWLASGSLDGTVRIWEVYTGRCVSVLDFELPVAKIQWNPNRSLAVLAVLIGHDLHLLQIPFSKVFVSEEIETNTLAYFDKLQSTAKQLGNETTWQVRSEIDEKNGIVATIRHPANVKQLHWHAKGDYIVTVSPFDTAVAAQSGIKFNKMVTVHQISSLKSQNPFATLKNQITCARFHPSKPILYVSTKQHVISYNLKDLKRERIYLTGCKWISSLSIQPGGNNFLIGSYDKKVSWFDTELSTKPYQTMKYHKKAVRNVVFHRTYPLFASCSDDRRVHVFHGKVYDDLLQNALIVPLKILKGHGEKDGIGVMDLEFHPSQPWLFSAGADGFILMFV